MKTMTLVSCPECNKQISDKAPTCPHCGVSRGKPTEQIAGLDAVIMLLSFVLSLFLVVGTGALVDGEKNRPLQVTLFVFSLVSPPIAALVWSSRRKV